MVVPMEPVANHQGIKLQASAPKLKLYSQRTLPDDVFNNHLASLSTSQLLTISPLPASVIVMTFWYVFGMDLTFSNFLKLYFHLGLITTPMFSMFT